MQLRYLFQCSSGPRSAAEFAARPCTPDCPCWEDAFEECTADNDCQGDLVCSTNTIAPPAVTCPDFPIYSGSQNGVTWQCYQYGSQACTHSSLLDSCRAHCGFDCPPAKTLSTPSKMCRSLSNAGCSDDSQCSNPNAPICTNSVCVGCSSNSQCLGDPAKSFCNINTGACEGCSSNSQCSGATPICGADGVCQACTSSLECTDATAPVCSANGSCTTCSVDSQCTDPKLSFCNASSGACEGCSSNSQCPGNAPFCSADGSCQPCSSHSQCTDAAASFCIAGSCQPCNSNDLCTDPNAPVCSSGSCRGCTADSECQTADSPFCSAGACVSCRSIDDCTDGLVCNGTGICQKCTQDSQCTNEEAPTCNDLGFCDVLDRNGGDGGGCKTRWGGGLLFRSGACTTGSK